MLSGEVTISLENQPYKLNCGDIFIAFPDQIHSLHTPEESTAKALGISKYYLSQLFATKLNSTLMTYLTSKRLDLAQKLLTTTDKSVTDIAFESGFSSSRTFFRCFQNKYHISPYKFKKSACQHTHFDKNFSRTSCLTNTTLQQFPINQKSHNSSLK